jgi:tRNA pseudouridine38-40 synthase
LNRYKIIIQYDGSFFSGWQLQKNKKTIQGEIENALRIITGSKSRIIVKGSGRTDAGVHAIGQVAHFDISTRLNDLELQKALNFYTSENCIIMEVHQTNEKFDARYHAKKRTYLYQIYVGDSILFKNQSWIIDKIDIKILNNLEKIILGEHDFLSFSKYNPKLNNTKSIIYSSRWDQKGDFFLYKICANRFLHHMIRYLVGTMVAVAKGNLSLENFKTLLHKPQKNVQIHRAPACGLQLLKVDYD